MRSIKVEAKDMTSEKQIEANRRNARMSTGPRTREGKASVRHNALHHGLTAQEVLIPDEDAEAYEDLQECLRRDLDPVGVVEDQLVDRIVVSIWRLRRVQRVEAGIFTLERCRIEQDRAQSEARKFESTRIDRIRSKELEIIDKTKHQQALAQVEKARSSEEEALTTLGLSFLKDAETGNAFSKLSRYETAIERTLYRALHELQRLQETRRGGRVATPLAVDVIIDDQSDG